MPTKLYHVSIPQRKGDALLITEDEEFKKVDFAKIPQLRPAFTKDGTVTAANASTINDGASAIVLASGRKVKELGLQPIAKIVAFADAAHEPQWFTTAPTIAAPIALKRADMDIGDIDYFEVRGFCRSQHGVRRSDGVDREKMNVLGGAVAIGHSLGASGARIITTLTNVLTHKNAQTHGSHLQRWGGASAMIIERV
ncbi:MAG: hypothetical protein R2795_09625 [Saprospiraceae bacterium]